MTARRTSATSIDAIERGEFPKWKFCVQIMPESDAGKHWYNPFDLTKVWPHEDYPLIEVGILELNRNPENYFAEVEQAALHAGQHRAGHRPSRPTRCCRRASSPMPTRIATASASMHEQLPVNKPRCPVHTYHADGAMRLAGNPRTRTPITSRTRSAGRCRTRA